MNPETHHGYLRLNQHQNGFIYGCYGCNSIFFNCEELEEHIFDHELANKRIHSLPIELIEFIFKFLSSNDLAAFSLTCRGYKQLTENYFDRERRSGVVGIRAWRSKIKFFSNSKQIEEYQKRFFSFIDHVEVKIYNTETIEKTFLFIREKCSKNLRRLTIEFPYGGFCMSDNCVELIADQIKQLDILTMGDVSLGDKLVKRCKNLRTLCINRYIISPVNENEFWLNENYPNLKTFIFFDPIDVEQIDLKPFLRENPQLKVVVLRDMSAIPSFFSIESNLLHSILYFDDDMELDHVWNDLRKNFRTESLDLIIEQANVRGLNRLLQLNCIKGFHMVLSNHNRAFFDHQIQSVERLCLTTAVPLTQQLLDKIIECFPNVYELRISMIGEPLAIAMGDILMQIVTRLKHLKHIYFKHHETIEISNECLDELHAARMNSQLVSLVTVHLNGSRSTELNSGSSVVIAYEEEIVCPLCRQRWKPDEILSYLSCLPAIRHLF